MDFRLVFHIWLKSCKKHTKSLSMFNFKFFALFAIGLFLRPVEIESKQKITVMFSQTEPFIHYKKTDRALQRLDFKIMENFGKKFKFDIEYVLANETLNEAFSTEDHFERFAQSILDL